MCQSAKLVHFDRKKKKKNVKYNSEKRIEQTKYADTYTFSKRDRRTDENEQKHREKRKRNKNDERLVFFFNYFFFRLFQNHKR